MSIQSGNSPDGNAAPTAVTAAMATLNDAMSRVLAIHPATVSEVGALEMLEELARERRRLEAAWLRAVAMADQLDATSVAGIPATLQQHLVAGTGSAPGRAKADIEAARALHGEPTRELIRTVETGRGPLAQMGELLAAGETSAAHVDTGVKTLDQMPDRLATEENLATITGFLTEHAPTTTPKQIKLLANRLIRRLEPETDDHYDADAYNRRSFTVSTDITGMVHGTFQLDPAAGAELIAILDPLSAPYPVQKDESGAIVARDERNPRQRRADGFTELLRAGAAYLGPANHASPPNDSKAGGDGFAREAGAAAVSRDGSSLRNGRASKAIDPSRHFGGVADLFSLDGANGGGPAGDATGINTDAPDGNEAPGSNAKKPPGSRAGKLRLSRRQNRISIVTTMDQIRTMEDRRTGRRTAVDTTESECVQIGSINTGTLSLMSCDALFERVVLDAKGALLDLGLPVRLASPAQKRALAVRDCGCIVPGCNRPPNWCETHHIIWYSHDGPTDTGNLALGCGSHHRAFHAGLLEAAMIDGVPYVRVTAKGAKTFGSAFPLGSVAHPEHQSWIRNSYFDQLKSADNIAKAIVVPDYPEHRWAA